MDETGRRGKLTIFLGYAAGVGKTYKMLEEAQQAKRQGHDVVVGYFEPHGRKDTIAKTEGLEMIPRRVIEYRGRDFEEMDTDGHSARVIPKSARSTNFRTPIFPARSAPSAGRTCWCCWMPESTC